MSCKNSWEVRGSGGGWPRRHVLDYRAVGSYIYNDMRTVMIEAGGY